MYRSSHPGVLYVKKMFLKMSPQNSQENNCVGMLA